MIALKTPSSPPPPSLPLTEEERELLNLKASLQRREKILEALKFESALERAEAKHLEKRFDHLVDALECAKRRNNPDEIMEAEEDAEEAEEFAMYQENLAEDFDQLTDNLEAHVQVLKNSIQDIEIDNALKSDPR